MKKWLVLFCAGLLIAGATVAQIPENVREQTLRVTDGATTANSFTLDRNDADTTSSIGLWSVAWPEDNSKPLGTLLLYFPNTTAYDEVIDSTLIKLQWSFNDTTWLGTRWDTSVFPWDTTLTNYVAGYKLIYADTTLDGIAPHANYLRFIIFQANNNAASTAETLGVIKGEFIYPVK